MNTRTVPPFAIVLLLVAVACNQAEKKDPAATAASAPATATPLPPPPAAAVDPVTAGEPTTQLAPDAISTPEDFEEEARRKLVSANLEVELDALEKEIAE
ncbi:MAG: hypothetical protein JW751_07225 [Polyangiaceae bacterium]|nr:hypothetical protein [Polyangiaceae bacterium]